MAAFNFNSLTGSWAILPLLVWILFWKGFALWTAAKKDHKVWFVIMLVLNTVGILEIIYLFWIAKKDWGDVKNVLKKIFVPKKK